MHCAFQCVQEQRKCAKADTTRLSAIGQSSASVDVAFEEANRRYKPDPTRRWAVTSVATSTLNRCAGAGMRIVAIGKKQRGREATMNPVITVDPLGIYLMRVLSVS